MVLNGASIYAHKAQGYLASSSGRLHLTKRFITLALLALLVLTLALTSLKRNVDHTIAHTIARCGHLLRHQPDLKYYSFNHHQKVPANDTQPNPHPRVLILTPLKNAAAHVEGYIQRLQNLSYPHGALHLAILVSDSTDDTMRLLQQALDRHINRTSPKYLQDFASITLITKDFGFDMSAGERHRFESQLPRRRVMALSRNYLLSSTLNPDIDYVLWLDVDVIEFPTTVLEDLMDVDFDVVAPNCFYRDTTLPPKEQWYDLNNWSETPQSEAFHSMIDPELPLFEGDPSNPSWHKLLVDMTDIDDRHVAVRLDGVGTTMTLVKADVHRSGAIFPPFIYKHQVESEGFAKMAKDLGFEVVGLPAYHIYHFKEQQ